MNDATKNIYYQQNYTFAKNINSLSSGHLISGIYTDKTVIEENNYLREVHMFHF